MRSMFHRMLRPGFSGPVPTLASSRIAPPSSSSPSFHSSALQQQHPTPHYPTRLTASALVPSLRQLSAARPITGRRGLACASTPAAASSAGAAPGASDGRKRVVFLGSPDVAALVLDKLLEASGQPGSTFQIAAVVTQPARPKGRGFKITPTPVEALARSKGFNDETILVPETAKDEAFLAALLDLRPDLCITAAYGNFLPRKFLTIPKFGTLNIHPSLLPKYRGATPVPRSIEAGDPVTGVSVLFTVLKMDAGPVLAAETVPMDPNVQAPQLLADLFVRGTELLVKSLPIVWEGRGLEAAVPQDESLATHAAKFSKEETGLDWTMPALTLHNKVRAFAGWPGTSGRFVEADKSGTGVQDLDVKVIETRVWEAPSGPEAKRGYTPMHDAGAAEGASTPPPAPGLVGCGVTWQGKTLIVPCGGGTWLEVVQVQLPGKKPVPSTAFVNGLQSRGGRLYIRAGARGAGGEEERAAASTSTPAATAA